MQVNLDAAELEETNRAAHRDGKPTTEQAAARVLLQGGGSAALLRNQQPHREHVGFEETVALEEVLRAQLGPVGQQGYAEEFFLFREIDGVLEQLRAVAVTAKGIVDDQVLEQDHEPAFRGADREKQVD